jgi:hypothetical protein
LRPLWRAVSDANAALESATIVRIDIIIVFIDFLLKFSHMSFRLMPRFSASPKSVIHLKSYQIGIWGLLQFYDMRKPAIRYSMNRSAFVRNTGIFWVFYAEYNSVTLLHQHSTIETTMRSERFMTDLMRILDLTQISLCVTFRKWFR